MGGEINNASVLSFPMVFITIIVFSLVEQYSFRCIWVFCQLSDLPTVYVFFAYP